MNQLLRPILWTLGGDAASRFASLAVTLIVARAVSPEEFSLYLSLLAVSAIAAAAWDFGLTTLLVREVSAENIAPTAGVRRALQLRARTIPVWVVAFIGGVGILTLTQDVSPFTAVLFGVASLISGLEMLFLGALRGVHHFRDASLVLGVGRALVAALSLVVYAVHIPEQAFALLAVALIMGGLVTVIAALFLLIQLDDWPSTPAGSLSLRGAIPYALNSVVSYTYNRMDIVIVGALASTASLTAYAPASRFQDMLFVVPGIISTALLPVMSRAVKNHGSVPDIDVIVVRASVIGLLCSIPIVLVMTMFADDVLRIVLGGGYQGSAGPVSVLVWFLPFSVLTAPRLAGLIALGRGADTTKVFAATLVAALLAHASLDWWAGATGAALASFVREPVGLAVAWMLYSKARSTVVSNVRIRPLEVGYDAD